MSQVRTLSASAAGTLTVGGDLTINRLGYGAMRVSGARNAAGVRDRDEAIRIYRRAYEHLGRPVRPIGVHSPGYIAESDEQAREELWPDYKRMRDRIGAEIHRRITSAIGPDAEPRIVSVLEMTFFGALVNAASGAYTYHQIADHLAYAVGLIVKTED